jgi:hypothetical protein
MKIWWMDSDGVHPLFFALFRGLCGKTTSFPQEIVHSAENGALSAEKSGLCAEKSERSCGKVDFCCGKLKSGYRP